VAPESVPNLRFKESLSKETMEACPQCQSSLKERVRALLEASAVHFNVDEKVTFEELAALVAAAGRGQA